MPNFYQDYNELAEFFGTDAFESLDVETLSTLSLDALFRLQALMMQAIAHKTRQTPTSYNRYNLTTENVSYT